MDTVLEIDDFQDADPGRTASGAAISGPGLAAADDISLYDDGWRGYGLDDQAIEAMNGFSRARALQWAAGQGRLAIDMGHLDARGREVLAFEVARVCPAPPKDPQDPDNNCPARVTTFAVQVTDGAGTSARTEVDAGMGENGIVGRHLASVRLPLSSLTGVDRGDLATIELLFDLPGAEEGWIWVDDLRIE
jgi:hypothetical protein